MGRRLAVNPIPYWSRGGRIDKSPAVFDEAFADFAQIGFTAVKADVPDGMNAADYLDWIGSYGLAPALSLFNSPFDETIDITEEVERAKKVRGHAGRTRARPDDDLLDGHPRPDGPAGGGRGLQC